VHRLSRACSLTCSVNTLHRACRLLQDATERCSAGNTAKNFCEISCARCTCCLSIAATAGIAGLTTFTEALHSLLLAAEEIGNTGLVPPSLWYAFIQPGANKTVFVPNNAAFDALAVSLGMTLSNLLTDTKLLNQVRPTTNICFKSTSLYSMEQSGFLTGKMKVQ